jgi:hypothetical protein
LAIVKFNLLTHNKEYLYLDNSRYPCGSVACEIPVLSVLRENLILTFGCGEFGYVIDKNLKVLANIRLEGTLANEVKEDCNVYKDLDLDYYNGFRWRQIIYKDKFYQYGTLPKCVRDFGEKNRHLPFITESRLDASYPVIFHSAPSNRDSYLQMIPFGNSFFLIRSDTTGTFLDKYKPINKFKFANFVSLIDKVYRNDSFRKLNPNEMLNEMGVSQNYVVWFPYKYSCKNCKYEWINSIKSYKEKLDICVISDTSFSVENKHLKIIYHPSFGDNVFKNPVFNPVIFKRSTDGYKQINYDSDINRVTFLLDSIFKGSNSHSTVH